MNKIQTQIKGHNSVTNVRKMMLNYSNLDLVNINAYTKFGKILSIISQDIEQKLNYNGPNDRQTDGMTDNSYPV